MNLAKLFTVICLFSAGKLWAMGPHKALCSPHYESNDLVSLDFGQRKIFVVGWDHLDNSEVKALGESYGNALQQSRRGNCSDSLNTIQEGLQVAAKSLSKSQDLLNALEGIEQRDHIGLIARELSPEEWAEALKGFRQIYQDLNEIAQSCGPQSIPLLKKFMTVAFGPEEAFAMRHSQSEVIGIESLPERLKNKESFRKPAREDFDSVDNPRRLCPGYNEISESLWLQRTPPEPAIKKLASCTIGPRNDEVGLRHDIEVWEERVAGAYRRNDAIVQNVQKTNGNIAIVIGFRHVRDLVEKLSSACRSASYSTPSEGAGNHREQGKSVQ